MAKKEVSRFVPVKFVDDDGVEAFFAFDGGCGKLLEQYPSLEEAFKRCEELNAGESAFFQ